MEDFPQEIRSEKIFSKILSNQELSKLRMYITLYPPVIINFRNNRLINYKNLLKIDEELKEMNFIITYVVMDFEKGQSVSKTVNFEDIDPFGTLPFQMIINLTDNSYKKM